MKKTFMMKNLKCANCAAKMENKIRKLDGVEFCEINFFNLKITLEAEEKNFDEIIKRQIKFVKQWRTDAK